MSKEKFKIRLHLGLALLGIFAHRAHADCPLFLYCSDGPPMDIPYSSPAMANYAAASYQGCQITRVSPTELKMCNPGKSDKAARQTAEIKQQSSSLKEIHDSLLRISSSDSNGCNRPNSGDFDRKCVNDSLNNAVQKLQSAAVAHPELSNAINALRAPCFADTSINGLQSGCVQRKIDKALDETIDPLSQKLDQSVSKPIQSSQPTIRANATRTRSSPISQNAVVSTRNQATPVTHRPAATSVTPDAAAAVPTNPNPANGIGGTSGAGVSGLTVAPAPGLNPTGAKAADATAAAIGSPVGGVSSDGNSVIVKPADVCANTKQIDYSKCTFVRFAGAENISNFKSGGNQVQHEDFASSSFNQFKVSCPGGDPQAKAQVCFGTVECQDVPIQDGNCDTSAPTQHQGKIIKKMRLEMAVACSPQGKTCDNVSAADCADPKKDGQTIQSIDEKDFAKTRRVGSSDVKSGTTQSGDAQK